MFSKAFEKLLHTRISISIKKHNLFVPAQHEFRQNKSAELALLEQKNILTKFKEKALIFGIFVGFYRVFNIVNHEILLNTLHYYGIQSQALLLMDSYLSSRRQVLSIKNSFSSMHPVLCGVLQGSILGPLLFNICLYDIINISKAKYIIYAEDTSIFFSGHDINKLIRTCNNTMITLER